MRRRMKAPPMPLTKALLPAARGKLAFDAPLKDMSWFHVGGKAEILFKPADEEDLASFLGNLPQEIPVTLLGAGSNTLIRDGGVPGVVVKLSPAFSFIKIDGEKIHVGGAALDRNIAAAACEAGLTGLEFLYGIPGTIAGGLRSNAGAHGGEIGKILESVTLVDRQGKRLSVDAKNIGLSYRACNAPEDWIFTSLTLRGQKGNREEIAKRMEEIQAERKAFQPIMEKTCGSTFANPPGEQVWKLIEKAGGRGLRLGGAMMSEQHCNFMINTGTATAADLERLGEEIRRLVKETSGHELRWEVRRIGVPLEKKQET